MGSGKSYFGAELCVEAWREKATVHSNIDFNFDRIVGEGFGEFFVPLGDNPQEWMEKIRPGQEGLENLVVIDEGMLLFNAHDWQTTQKRHRALIEFLVWSRKLGLDVYLIGQAQKGMDVAFTRMSQHVIRCVKVKEVPVIGPMWAQTRGDFLRIWCSPDGRKTGKKQFKRFDPFVGAMYKTESTHGRFDGLERHVTRQGKMSVPRAGKGWAVLATVLLLVRGLFFASRTFAMRLFEKQVGKLDSGKPAESAKEGAVETRVITRVETPALPSSPAPANGAEVKESRFRMWGCTLGRGVISEAFTGRVIQSGSVYDDAIVRGVVVQGRIYKVRLDDGRELLFRPVERADWREHQEKMARERKGEMQPWTKLPSLESISALSSGVGG